MECSKNKDKTVQTCQTCIAHDRYNSCKPLWRPAKSPMKEIISEKSFSDCEKVHGRCIECVNKKWCSHMLLQAVAAESVTNDLFLGEKSFKTGDYPRWVASFQQRNPDSISFSNRVSAINNMGVQLVSLNPLKIRSKDIEPEDFENLALLSKYYSYLKTEFHIEESQKTVVIEVDGRKYALTDVTTTTDKETIINVVVIDNDSDIESIVCTNSTPDK